MGKKCVFFDLDGTWYRFQLFASWIIEMVEAGLLPRIILEKAKPAYIRYKNREGAFGDWVTALVRSYQDDDRLKGIRVADAELVAERVIEQRGKRIHVFTRELANAAKERGMMTAVISGSPSIVVEAFARANDIGLWLGTEHPTGGGYFLGGTPKVWAEDKASALRVIARKNDVELRESVAIGDSMSDVGMFTQVGYPIAFNPERRLCLKAYEEGWPVVLEKKDAIHALRCPHPEDRSVIVRAHPRSFLPRELEGVAETLKHLLVL